MGFSLIIKPAMSGGGVRGSRGVGWPAIGIRSSWLVSGGGRAACGSIRPGQQPVGGGRKPGGNAGNFPKKAAFKHVCQRAGGGKNFVESLSNKYGFEQWGRQFIEFSLRLFKDSTICVFGWDISFLLARCGLISYFEGSLRAFEGILWIVTFFPANSTRGIQKRNGYPIPLYWFIGNRDP